MNVLCYLRRLALICIISILGTAVAFAYDFEADDIYYNITSEANLTVEITYKSIFSVLSYSGEVVIPDCVTYGDNTYSVTSIGDYAFCPCSDLTSVEIPNSVTSIGNLAFENCTALTSVEIPNSVTSIGWQAFKDCTSLTSVKIPNSVTSIRDHTFQKCISLTSVEIPNGVTNIGDWAFEDCSALTRVEIGNSVTSIGAWAFENCDFLEDVYILNMRPPKCDIFAFSKITQNNATFHVPAKAVKNYKKNFWWRKFANIVEYNGSEN